MKVKSLSRVRLLATPWTAAYQAPPSMGFSRQEHWSGVPLPSPLYHWEAQFKHTQIYLTLKRHLSEHLINLNMDWVLDDVIGKRSVLVGAEY